MLAGLLECTFLTAARWSDPIDSSLPETILTQGESFCLGYVSDLCSEKKSQLIDPLGAHFLQNALIGCELTSLTVTAHPNNSSRSLLCCCNLGCSDDSDAYLRKLGSIMLAPCLTNNCEGEKKKKNGQPH